MTQGKGERWHQTLKNRIFLDGRMPVKYLTQLAAELKTRILEKVEPGQNWVVSQTDPVPVVSSLHAGRGELEPDRCQPAAPWRP
jgi:hypothetical protein